MDKSDFRHVTGFNDTSGGNSAYEFLCEQLFLVLDEIRFRRQTFEEAASRFHAAQPCSAAVAFKPGTISGRRRVAITMPPPRTNSSSLRIVSSGMRSTPGSMTTR